MAASVTGNRYAVLSGNTAMAMGGAAAGVKFSCAYPHQALERSVR